MNSQIKINGRIISKNHPPYLIAEISANHNGSIENAMQTIKAAKESGVDAVKIQTYTPDTMTIESNFQDFIIKKGLWKNRSLYDLYKEAHTPFDWQEKLFNYAAKIGVTIFSSPFDESAVDLLERLKTPAYKVASFELVDIPLISYIAKKRKPMLMSTGMASIEEIGEALEAARSNGCKEIGLFHCISSYPAPLKEANIKMISTLRKEFKVEVGLSDHTLGNIASIVATSIGASLIEKHFTIDRSKGGVDSAFSIEPQEMNNLEKNVKNSFESLGEDHFRRPNCEEENKIFRRSLYFVKDLEKGEKINSENVRRIRPGYGLAPKYLERILGKRVNTSVKKGDRVHFDKIESIDEQ